MGCFTLELLVLCLYKLITSGITMYENLNKVFGTLMLQNKHFFQVYTINLESRYLLIQGVPALGVMKELVELFALYGTIEEYNPLDDYPAEEFTEVYLIKFQKIQSARYSSLNCHLW